MSRLPALPLTTAQRSNFVPLTAWGYMAWRERSLGWLSGESFSLEREQRLFLGHCRPVAGEQWLDIGTSAGFYAGVLAGAGATVMAVDLSPAMLREAQRRHPHAATTWQQANAEALPPKWAGHFDGVTVGATLNETHAPGQLLAEAARVLRPGGQLWLMYLRGTGGPLQGLLSRPLLGGLSFPEAAWVSGKLPGCPLVTAAQFGPVRFEHRVKVAGPARALSCPT